MFEEKIYLVVGISTDIGKTFLVENLCRLIPHSFAVKPVASGFNDDDKKSDSARIISALDIELSQSNLDKISPWRFADPVSPHIAAKNSDRKIVFEDLFNFCVRQILEAKKLDNFLFIEAAGGVMTPINEDKTFLDLAAELKIPTLLVSADYLGAISHTLCSLLALESRGVKVERIIVNQDLPNIDHYSQTFIESLEKFSKVKVVSMSGFLSSLSAKAS